MAKQKRKNTEIYEIISYNIKKYRKKKGITQAQLAELVGVSHEYIRRIESEKGEKTFTIYTISEIAKALDVDIRNVFDPNDEE